MATADVVYWPRHLRGSSAAAFCIRLNDSAVCVVALGSGREGLERLPKTPQRVVLFDAQVASLADFTALHSPALLERIGRELSARSNEQGELEMAGGALRWMMEALGYYAIYVPCTLLLAATAAFRYMVEEVRTPVWLVVGGGKSLTDLSTCLAVCSHQLHNAATLPSRVRQLSLTSKHRRLSHQEKMELLDVLNWACIAMLDVVLGRLVFTYLTDLLASTVPITNSSPQIAVEFLRENVEWLMGAPAGFKLNKPLASILGNGILLWLDLWEFVFAAILPHRINAGLARWLLLVFTHVGVTLQLTLLSDLVNAATWHSHWVYLYFAKLNRLQFGLFSSLSKLFLGKKINVLRHRVDSCEYDVGQLLLGTLLFTILVFLVTTNLVFFVFFGAVRGAILLVSLLLWVPVVVLHSLPLASLVYRAWRPHFFVIGMQLQTCVKTETGCSNVVSVDNIGLGYQPPRLDAQNRRSIRRALASCESVNKQRGEDALFELAPVVCSSLAHFTRLRAYLQGVAKRYSFAALLQAWLFGKADIERVPLAILFGLADWQTHPTPASLVA